MKRLGLIVNPLAGIGGRVGLKGSDGEETVRRALDLGATCLSPRRSAEALTVLAQQCSDVELLTYPGPMGEEAALAAGFKPTVLGKIDPAHTSAADTRRAASELLEASVDLLVFAGGDGTARDIYDAVADVLPVVGIPGGCKMHSAVFAANPPAAGELAALYLQGKAPRTSQLEVMDIDEDAFRAGLVDAQLYGYLRIPFLPRLTQGAKAGRRSASEEASVPAIAERIVEDMRPGRLYIVGSGTTTRAIMERLGLPNTLLGVDVVLDAALLAADVAERELLALLPEASPQGADMIVTPVGGQGYIFGRGNQQLSPAVIARVGVENIRVVATAAKLQALPLHRLRVDTGCPAIDARLRGYRRVVTSYREFAVVEVV